MFLPSRLAALILFFLLRVKVTHKTVCEWTKKFADEIILPSYKYTSDILICHADEKYVKVKGEWNFWWSIKECLGNVICNVVTDLREFASANNPAESLNSEIDFYLGKFRNNFVNLESANRFANLFMLSKYLKKSFMEKKFLEASSMLEQAILI